MRDSFNFKELSFILFEIIFKPFVAKLCRIALIRIISRRKELELL